MLSLDSLQKKINQAHHEALGSWMSAGDEKLIKDQYDRGNGQMLATIDKGLIEAVHRECVNNPKHHFGMGWVINAAKSRYAAKRDAEEAGRAAREAAQEQERSRDAKEADTENYRACFASLPPELQEQCRADAKATFKNIKNPAPKAVQRMADYFAFQLTAERAKKI